MCAAEQTHQAQEDFPLWEGGETAFTELPEQLDFCIGKKMHPPKKEDLKAYK